MQIKRISIFPFVVRVSLTVEDSLPFTHNKRNEIINTITGGTMSERVKGSPDKRTNPFFTLLNFLNENHLNNVWHTDRGR